MCKDMKVTTLKGILPSANANTGDSSDRDPRVRATPRDINGMRLRTYHHNVLRQALVVYPRW